LVDRNGTAPDFVRDFSNAGYYTASLRSRSPIPAIVLNSVFWSSLYQNVFVDPKGDVREQQRMLPNQVRRKTGEFRRTGVAAASAAWGCESPFDYAQGDLLARPSTALAPLAPLRMTTLSAAACYCVDTEPRRSWRVFSARCEVCGSVAVIRTVTDC